MATIEVTVTVRLRSGASQPWCQLVGHVPSMIDSQVRRAIDRRRAEGPRPPVQQEAPDLYLLMADLGDAVERDVMTYAGRKARGE